MKAAKETIIVWLFTTSITTNMPRLLEVSLGDCVSISMDRLTERTAVNSVTG